MNRHQDSRLLTPSATPPTVSRSNSYASSSSSPFKRQRLSSATRHSSTPDLSTRDFDKAREASARKMVHSWAGLVKYSKGLDQDDIFDLRTGEIIQNRGVLQSMEGRWEFGRLADGEESENDDNEEELQEEDAEEEDSSDELDTLTSPKKVAENAKSDEVSSVPLPQTLRHVPALDLANEDDAEDLREFLEAERQRRALCGEDDSADEALYDLQDVGDVPKRSFSVNLHREIASDREDSGSDDELAVNWTTDAASAVYDVPEDPQADGLTSPAHLLPAPKAADPPANVKRSPFPRQLYTPPDSHCSSVPLSDLEASFIVKSPSKEPGKGTGKRLRTPAQLPAHSDGDVLPTPSRLTPGVVRKAEASRRTRESSISPSRSPSKVKDEKAKARVRNSPMSYLRQPSAEAPSPSPPAPAKKRNQLKGPGLRRQVAAEGDEFEVDEVEFVEVEEEKPPSSSSRTHNRRSVSESPAKRSVKGKEKQIDLDFAEESSYSRSVGARKRKRSSSGEWLTPTFQDVAGPSKPKPFRVKQERSVKDVETHTSPSKRSNSSGRKSHLSDSESEHDRVRSRSRSRSVHRGQSETVYWDSYHHYLPSQPPPRAMQSQHEYFDARTHFIVTNAMHQLAALLPSWQHAASLPPSPQTPPASSSYHEDPHFRHFQPPLPGPSNAGYHTPRHRQAYSTFDPAYSNATLPPSSPLVDSSPSASSSIGRRASLVSRSHSRGRRVSFRLDDHHVLDNEDTDPDLDPMLLSSPIAQKLARHRAKQIKEGGQSTRAEVEYISDSEPENLNDTPPRRGRTFVRGHTPGPPARTLHTIADSEDEDDDLPRPPPLPKKMTTSSSLGKAKK